MLRKSVIITGASSGIGRETALLFASKGYNIIIAKHKTCVKTLEDEIKKFGVEYQSIYFDLCDEKSIIEFYSKAFNGFEYIETVVNCAGVALKEKMFIDVSDKEIKEIISANLIGTMICCREALKYFTSQKHGNLINISSILGETGGSFEATYSSSKGGINALTKSLAVEYSPYNIRINAVAPGFIETNMTSGITGENRENCLNQIPQNRFGRAIDVANVIYFLSQEASSYITGQIIGVNGGAIRFD